MKIMPLLLSLSLGITLGAGAILWHHGETASRAEDGGGRTVLYYRHPHNPAIRSDEPRKDEMGMDFIPIYAGDTDPADEGGVRISPRVIQNMGVRTAAAERGELTREIRTVGFVTEDEAGLAHVHLRTEGWIEDLRVRTTGEAVRAGQILFRIYSPLLVNAQEELLQILRRGGPAEPARERLRALGLSRDTIREVESRGQALTRVPVTAPRDGIVTALNVAEGMFVTPGTEVMRISDLSRVWVMLDLFEQQAAAVSPGSHVTLRLPAHPDEVLEGRLDYLYPTLTQPTRTVRARLGLDNPDGILRPGAWVEARLAAIPTGEVVHVPVEAVIRTGHENRVVLALEEGRFQVRQVALGRRAGDRLEILAGIEAGDKVVVSGQFLIDSEAAVSVALARLETPEDGGDTHDDSVPAEGRINRVDREARRVNLYHEPIPALGWPAMTMDFEVADGVSLEGLSPGDAVHIRIREREEYVYELTHVAPRPGDAP
ncbi:hypothetical protein CKO35_13125 [Ectothiorhodospira shaposhnikovii]|uniref:efflux RND transporter periplasmic adaptor subunit n=1 Tax=Ectothiorhodospira shaposhnikovii TaxID=1054 RepID=UPI001904E670|nr:efflux RND transporter periplasmic adaptor subunit [Ectothiorhodospira shaposhnikovii]MBK1674229.1 hypothetical protein [Ectothiorhodospira shaposhnikovii]